MTESRGKEFTDAQYRALGIDPENARTRIPVSEFLKKISDLEPVDADIDTTAMIREERDGARGTRLWRLEQLSKPSLPKKIINRIRRPRGK